MKEKRSELYKGAYSWAIKLTMLFIGVYYTVMVFFPELFGLQAWWSKVLVKVVEFTVFTAINAGTYKIICAVKKAVWKKKHKDIWVDGFWLTIHAKNNGSIRIGMVKVKQEFYSISARGINMNPENVERKTTWNYHTGEVFDNETALDWVGCYTAQKIQPGGNNAGVHMLQIIENDEEGYVTELGGWFCDIVAAKTLDMLELADHNGSLHLFRVSKECQKYLNGLNRNEKLSTLHKMSEFQNEPYVRALLKKMQNASSVSG